MNKKHSAFSLGLLREGFRQCQMIGILALVITVLGAIIFPVAQAVSAHNNLYYVTEVWNAWNANPLLLAAIIVAPIMTLVLFHFLDNRAASDLYHAMPHKRITLYASYAGAIILWIAILIVASTLVSMASCAIVHQQITLMYDSILPYVCSIFFICLLTISGMLIAMGLSGTIFTNLLLAAILLFLPRFCAVYLNYALTGSMPFVAEQVSANHFFQSSNNLLFSMVASILGVDNSSSVQNVLQPVWQALVYTLILALLYFAIGGWIFCRRRSESAGQSAPSRMSQHIYRIVVTMTFCTFVTGGLHETLESGSIGDEWFSFLVLYLVAILIYCAYELITTKKWHNLLRALPGLGVVVVLNGAILLGLHIAREKIVDQRPAVQEIESVSFRSNNSSINQGDFLAYSQYVDLASQKIEITDPTVISLVSYYLNENIESWQQDNNQYYDEYYNYNRYVSYIVTIRTKDQSIDRIIQIPSSESSTLVQALQSNQDFVDAWMNPPTPIEGTLQLSDYTGDTLSDDDTEALYQTYLEEFQQCSFADLYAAQMSVGSSADMRFSYTFKKYGYTCTVYCPVYNDLMPKTLQEYYNKIYAAQTEQREQLAEITNSSDVFYGDISINAYGGTDGSEKERYANCTLTETTLSEAEEYQDLADYMQDGALQAGDSYAEIWIYPYEDGNTIALLVKIDSAFFNDERTTEYYDTGSYTG